MKNISWNILIGLLVIIIVLLDVIPRCSKQNGTSDVDILTNIVFYDSIGGMKKGMFSVSDNKKVQFSRGNLLYNPENNEWYFALWQGATTSYNGYCISTFTWNGSDSPFRPIDPRLNLNRYNISKHQVYKCYPIKNGGNLYNQWRMLDITEWNYLLLYRPHARELLQRAEIAMPKNRWQSGVFLFPDGWQWPEDVKKSWDIAYYSVEEWQKLMLFGAVFLPHGGDHFSGTGYTWTSSYEKDTLNRIHPYYIDHRRGGGICGKQSYESSYRVPIRLVRDVD